MPQIRTEAAWNLRIREYGLRGYYDPRAFSRSHEQAASLVKLIEQLQARRAMVVIVLTPEHSTLRQRVPPEAMAALLDPLTRRFAQDIPPIIDVRDAIPDSGFTDISHLNDAGRALFTPLLAEMIHRHVPSHPPLMGRHGDDRSR